MSSGTWDDGGWAIGYDVDAAMARKALRDAGITPETIRSMTRQELERVPGLDSLCINRLRLHKLYADWETH